MTPYIVIAKLCDNGFYREHLEAIEGQTFDNLDDAKKALQDLSPDSCLKSVSWLTLGEFTTDWNDTDNEGEYLNIMDSFIGYIFIK